MGHVLVFMDVIILLVGIWVAFTLKRTLEDTRVPILRPILNHIILVVLSVFVYLIAKYAYVNLIAEDFSTARPAWMVVLALAGFCVELGVAWTLVQAVAALRNRTPSKAFMVCFYVVIGSLGAGFVMGTTIALEGGGVRWLVGSYAAAAAVALAVIIAFLTGLVVGREPELDPGDRRAARVLGALWLSGWIPFAVCSLLPGFTDRSRARCRCCG